MNRDKYLTPIEFCDDHSFRKWVLNGEDEDGWLQWLESTHDQKTIATEARYLLLAMGKDVSDKRNFLIDQALKEIWEKINEK